MKKNIIIVLLILANIVSITYSYVKNLEVGLQQSLTEKYRREALDMRLKAEEVRRMAAEALTEAHRVREDAHEALKK